MGVEVRSLAVFSTVKMQSLPYNGVTVVFQLITVQGILAAVLASSDLLVVVDGVLQEPDVAYVASGDQIQFTTAPSADSTGFIVWFQH